MALLIVGSWTAVALAITQVQLLAFVQADAPIDRWELLGWNLWSAWLWAAFTPAILHLARRRPVDRAGWPRTVPVHAAGALALCALDALGNHLVSPWLCPYPEAPTLGEFFLRHLPVNVASYLVVSALGHARRYAELYRDRRLAAARLETELASARLAALQAQLHPHFLFNTLNAIAEQVHLDPHAADAMILRLGKLLRASLRTPERPELPLRDELVLTSDYLELMRLRLRDRLRVRVAVPDELLDVPVPALVLQPLVENAIRHGIERRSAAGTVEVTARAESGRIVLEVLDDGPGLDGGTRAAIDGSGMGLVNRAGGEVGGTHAAMDGSGMGLANTRARLRHLHGDAATLVLRGRAGGGAGAIVTLPLAREAA